MGKLDELARDEYNDGKHDGMNYIFCAVDVILNPQNYLKRDLEYAKTFLNSHYGDRGEAMIRQLELNRG